MTDTIDPKEINGKWQHLCNYCLDLYERFSASEYRKKKKTEIENSVKAYEQEEVPTDDPWEGAQNIILPLTTISADNLEPRLVAGLVGKQPFTRFDTDQDPEPDQITELEQWFNDELDQVVKIVPQTGHQIHRLLQDGTVFAEACYDYQERTRRDFMIQGQEPPELQQAQAEYAMAMQQYEQEVAERQAQFSMLASQPPPTDISGEEIQVELPATIEPPEQPKELAKIANAVVQNGVYVDQETGEPVWHDIVEKTFEGVKIKLLSWDDIYSDDTIPNDDWEQAQVIKRFWTTYGALQRDKTKPGYIKKAIGPHLLRDKVQSVSMEGAQEERDSVKIIGQEPIECIACYVSYTKRDEDEQDEDVKDWSEDRYVVTIAVDAKIIIRRQLLREVNYNNRHLIRRLPLFPEKGKLYGTSIWGKMKSIQRMADEVFNLALNTAEIVLIPWFFYGQSSGWKGDKKELKPGIGIPVDSTKDILFPQFPINPSQFFAYLEFIIGFWERLFNVGDLQIGRNTDRSKTATEALAVIQEGNISHNYRANSLKDYFLEQIEVIYDMYYMHLPLDYTWTRGQKPMPIARADMRRARNFRLTSSTEMANKLIERREAEDRWGKVVQGHELGIANIVEGYKDLIQNSGVEDPERFINPAISQIVHIIQEQPQMAQVFMQVAQQAAAQAAMVQQAGGKPQPGGGNSGPESVSTVGGVQGVSPATGAGGGRMFARPSDVGGLAA